MHAVKEGYSEASKILKEEGAKIDQINQYGDTDQQDQDDQAIDESESCSSMTEFIEDLTVENLAFRLWEYSIRNSAFIISLFYSIVRYNIYILLILLCSVLLSLYHVALERGIIQNSILCVHSNIDFKNLTQASYLASIMNEQTAPCNNATMKIVHISLAEINLILSVALFVVFCYTQFAIYRICFSPKKFLRDCVDLNC
ncbi:MAG: disulfide bond formation protein B [Rickettsia sp.]|nr:disulfide bond formation protein B [Rickettsia sp.]